MTTKDIAKQVDSIALQNFLDGAQQELETSSINTYTVIQSMDAFKTAYDQYDKLRKNIKRQNRKGYQQLPGLLAERDRLQENAYDKFFKFQEDFNNYFGQHMQMVFVTEDLELILIDNSIADLQRNQWGKLSYMMQNIKNGIILKADDDYDPTSLKNTATEVYHRWDVAVSKHAGKAQHLPILWKSGGRWMKAMVNNKGTIAEAYANFFINKIYFLASIEENVGKYVMDEIHGMRAVDNTSGFVVGDVQQGDNSHVQFGVKTNLASPMGMAQVAKLIQQLSSFLHSTLTADWALKEIKKKLSVQGKWKQVSEATEVMLDNKIEELEQIISSY